MEGMHINQPIHPSNCIGDSELVKAMEEPIPISAGQSSPCSPIELDELGRQAIMGHKKVVEFAPILNSPNNRIAASLVESCKGKVRGPRVSFARSVMHKEVRHINDFTSEEVSKLWMTAPDYQVVRKIVKTTVLKMMRGQIIPEDDEQFCSRGLEYRTKAGSKARSQTKLHARMAVLNEQDIQRDEGFEDPSFIAMVCMEASKASRDAARARGAADELSVRDYLLSS